MKKVWHGSSRSNRKGAVRDFYRKPYGNPLFSRRGHRRSGRAADIVAAAKKTLIWTIVLAIVGTAAWYVIWSPAFRISSVEITGAAPATEQTLHEILDKKMSAMSWLILPTNNIFFFKEKTALAAMSKKFLFESVQVRKKLPHTVSIEVKEKEPRAVLVTGNRFLAVDPAGFVIRDLTEKEIYQLSDLPPGYSTVQVQGLGAESMDVSTPPDTKVTAPPSKTKGPAAAEPVKKNKNPLPLIVEPDPSSGQATKKKPGDAAVAPTTLSLILEAYSRLPDIAGAGVRWFVVDDASDSVRVTMEGDWTVFLSTSVPFDIQGQRLMLVLKDKVGARKIELEYVDLRYNERIFFRFKGAVPAK